jgi:hypothetical protein
MQCFLRNGPLPKTYQFEFDVDMEYPFSQPSALVLGLNSYFGGNIRSRGSCDNIQPTSGVQWNDLSHLWNPTKTYPGAGSGLVNWSLMYSYPAPSVRRLVWKATTSAESLLLCTDQYFDDGLVMRLQPDPISNPSFYKYLGAWHMTRTSPVSMDDESLGEMVLYDMSCSFGITESNNNTNVVVIQAQSDNDDDDDDDDDDDHHNHHDGNSIEVISNWVKVSCSQDHALLFILETCASVTGGNAALWVKLNDPTVAFSNTTGLNVTIISLQSGIGGGRQCNAFDPNNMGLCCQRWMIKIYSSNSVTQTAIEQNFQGNFYIEWKASVCNIHYEETHSPSNFPFVRRKVRASLTVNITNACQNKTILDTAHDQINGALVVYTDSHLHSLYDIHADEPFEDCDRVFLKLTPNVAQDICLLYNLVIQKVVIVYNRTKLLSGGGTEVTEIYDLVYDVNSNHINTIHKSLVVTPSGQCHANISWAISKPRCITRHHDGGGDGDSEHWTGSQHHNHDGLFWNGEAGEWVHLNEDNHKRTQDHDEEDEDDENSPCNVKVIVYWELVPINGNTEDKKRGLSTIQLNDDYDDHIPYHGYEHHNSRHVLVRCKPTQHWNMRLGRCEVSAYNSHDAWIWIFLVPFMIIPFALLFFVCLDCSNRRGRAHLQQQNRIFSGIHTHVIQPVYVRLGTYGRWIWNRGRTVKQEGDIEELTTMNNQATSYSSQEQSYLSTSENIRSRIGPNLTYYP